MRLGYYDRGRRAPDVRLMVLPRERGEGREGYVRRFFREVTGLGNVALCLIGARSYRVIARRGL